MNSMNKKVREYLIEIARGYDPTVFYSELVSDNRLRIDLSTPEGQEQLKQLLIEISTYENDHKRPMLTALAINKRANDPGPGFYELAERFGHGKKVELKRTEWGKEEADRVRTFWRNENNYQQFAKGEPRTSHQNPIAKLFQELSFSDEYPWAKDDWWGYYIDFVIDIKKLQGALVENPRLNIDSPKLYKTLSEPIRSYETFMHKWLKEHRNGISSRGQSVLSGENFETIIEDDQFKKIAKLVLNDPSPTTYKLLSDWWSNNEKISNRPLLINRALAACLPETLSSTVDNAKFWYVVSILKAKYGFRLSADAEANWFSANEELTRWLDAQLERELNKVSSDKLEQQVWRNIFVWLIYEKFRAKQQIPSNELIRQEPPQDGYDQMPPSKSNFEGEDVDFERRAKEQKELGDAGEELVKQYEIKELLKLGMHKQAEQVRIAKIGEGFDVYSFDKKGKEKFIEVKTTTGSWKNRFYLTRHELNFMEEHKSNYSLYRVYNFDEENNSGEFFELTGNVEERTIKEPISFEVVIKKMQRK